MKEFVEKLIARLEEAEKDCLKMYDWAGQSAIIEVKEIVNQLAEEYNKKREEVSSKLLNGEWVDTEDVERYLGIDFKLGFRLFDFSRMAEWNPAPLNGQKITTQFRMKCKNNGWIPCSERLPEVTEGTEYFKQSKCCLVTLKWWDGDMTESVGWYNQSGVWNEDSKNCKVVAWMPLPEPYTQKGVINGTE